MSESTLSESTLPDPSKPKPRLVITMGDPAGIGSEIIVKSFSHRILFDRCQPLVIGSVSCLESLAKQIGVNIKFTLLSEIRDFKDDPDCVQVIEPVSIRNGDFEQGVVSKECGKAAVTYFEQAIKLAMGGEIDGIVTCPANKEAIHLAGFLGDTGHQEILARMTGSKLTATMLMTRGLKVAHLSTHLSLAEAVAYVKTPVIVDKLRLTVDSMKAWGISDPKIAVAGLNPHGGEGGMLGREEIEQIEPAIAKARAEGINAVGPYPADSVFYRAIAGEFDAVLALYHDQGHIAIKVHNFEDSITATMGIPFVRTSVDHGTAFDIAGKNKANANGLSRAVDAAIDMLNRTLA